MVAGEKSPIVELRPGVFLIPGERPGSHIYLVKGSDKNVLIDTGTTAGFPRLKEHLRELGLRRHDIHLVILSHEHFDHIGAAAFFTSVAVIGAHRLAANKIELQDEFVTLNKYFNAANRQFRADLWLEDGCLIDVGNYKLQVIHTPGHTSGCICLYEPDHKFLFSGDTVFANGTLSDIAASGSISDYVSSLQRLSSLRISELYPAHGKTSLAPEEEMKRALEYARSVLNDSKLLFEALAKREAKATREERLLKRPWSGMSRPGNAPPKR